MLECSDGHRVEIHVVVSSDFKKAAAYQFSLEEIYAIIDMVMEGGCPVCSGMIV